MTFDIIAKHVNPSFIIDCGANVGYTAKEMRAQWPNAQFLLIEANPECEAALKETGFPYVIAVLSDRVKEVDFYTLRDCGTATGASYYRENTPFFEGDKAVATKRTTTTLDTLFIDIKDTNNLLKLDTQGSELDILRGAMNLLPKISAVLMEVAYEEYNLGAPTLLDVYEFMTVSGFSVIGQTSDIVHPIHRERVIQGEILWMRRE